MQQSLKTLIAAIAAVLLSHAAEAEVRSCGKIGRAPCVPFFTPGWAEIAPRICEEHLEAWLLFAICGPKVDTGINGGDAGDTLNKLTQILGKFGSGETQSDLDPLLKAIEALKNGDPSEEDIRALQAIVYENDNLEALLDVMREAGMKTMTIGESFSAAAVEGKVTEFGWAFDVNKKDLIRPYVAEGTSRGIQANIGTDLVISGFRKPNGCIGGKAYGVGGAIDIIIGTGAVFWADERGVSEGFSTSLGLKGIGGGFAQFIVETKLKGIGGCQTDQPAPVIPPPAPAPVRVTVARGDTLWAIAEAELGAGLRYPEIFAANQPPLADPDLIYPGQELTIPQE